MITWIKNLFRKKPKPTNVVIGAPSITPASTPSRSTSGAHRTSPKASSTVRQDDDYTARRRAVDDTPIYTSPAYQSGVVFSGGSDDTPSRASRNDNSSYDSPSQSYDSGSSRSSYDSGGSNYDSGSSRSYDSGSSSYDSGGSSSSYDSGSSSFSSD